MSGLKENNNVEFKKRRKDFLKEFSEYSTKYGFKKYNLSSVVKEYDDLYVILNMQKSSYSYLEYFNVIFLFKELMNSDFKSYFKKWSTGHQNIRVHSLQKNSDKSFYDLEDESYLNEISIMKKDVDFIQKIIVDLDSKENFYKSVILSDKYNITENYWVLKWFNIEI